MRMSEKQLGPFRFHRHGQIIILIPRRLEIIPSFRFSTSVSVLLISFPTIPFSHRSVNIHRSNHNKKILYTNTNSSLSTTITHFAKELITLKNVSFFLTFKCALYSCSFGFIYSTIDAWSSFSPKNVSRRSKGRVDRTVKNRYRNETYMYAREWKSICIDQHMQTEGLSLTTNEQSAIVRGWHSEADILVSEERRMWL